MTYKIISVAPHLIEVEYFKEFGQGKDKVDARFLSRVFGHGLDIEDHDSIVAFVKDYWDTHYANAKVDVIRTESGKPILDADNQNHGVIVPDEHPLAGLSG